MSSTVPVWRAAAALAAKELRIEGRRLESVSTSLLFALASGLLFQFAFDDGSSSPDGTSAGMIWTILTFSSIVVLSRAFAVEREHDVLAALVAAPFDRSALLLGKLAANAARMVLLALFALGWVALTTAAGSIDWPRLVGSVALFGGGLAVLGTLFGAVSAKLGRGDAALATLLLPAATPLLLGGVRTSQAALQSAPLGGRWWMLGAGFVLLYFVLALAVFEFILED